VFGFVAAHLDAIDTWRAMEHRVDDLKGYHVAAVKCARVCYLLATSRKSRAYSHARAVLQLPPFGGTGTKDKVWQPYMRDNTLVTLALLRFDMDACLGSSPTFACLHRMSTKLWAMSLNPTDTKAVEHAITCLVPKACTPAGKHIVSIMSRWYKRKKDLFFMYHAAAAATAVDITLPTCDASSSKCVGTIISDVVDGIFARRLTPMIDDGICDVHTAKGRARGKTPVDFALLGARVENEDPSLHNAACIAAYVILKLANEDGRSKTAGELHALVAAAMPALEDCLSRDVVEVIARATARPASVHAAPLTTLKRGAEACMPPSQKTGETGPCVASRKVRKTNGVDAAYIQQLCAGLEVPYHSSLSSRCKAAIAGALIGQRITSLGKPMVYIGKTGTDGAGVVVKGPYTGNDRLSNVLMYTAAIRAIGNVVDMPTMLPILAVEHDALAGHVYLTYTNVLKLDAVPVQRTGDDESLERNRCITIVDRRAYDRRLSALESRDVAATTPGIRIMAMQHLYMRYIVGAGDSGLHNILVPDVDNECKPAMDVVGVDVDDARSETGTPVTDMNSLLQLRSPAATFANYAKLVAFMRPITEDELTRAIAPVVQAAHAALGTACAHGAVATLSAEYVLRRLRVANTILGFDV
jgi:hypothetical protein